MADERMSKKPVIIKNGETRKLERILLNSNTFKEEWLQNILEKEPSLLPTAHIDTIFAPLFCIGREIPLPSGYVDNLYISPKGYIVLVETKLWRNSEARREVVGQIIDYAKDLKEWSYEDLDNAYRSFYKTNKSLFQAMVEAGFLLAENEALFIDTTVKNVKNARFLLMIVGDGIRESVERMAEFLNEAPSMQYRLALCELEVYDLGNDERLVIPQLTTKTKIIERGIIRIEEGSQKVSIEMYSEEEKETNKSTSSSKTITTATYDTLIKQLSEINSSYTKENIDSLLLDLNDLGFVYHLGSTECVISYLLPEYNTKIPVFRISFSPNNPRTWFVPIDILSKLDKLGFSRTIGNSLFDSLRIYLDKEQKYTPYERENAFYYISLNTILYNKDKILGILEDFKSNF